MCAPCEVRALFVLLLDIVWHNITWHLLINWECPTLITWMVNTISNDNYLFSPVLGGESGNEVTLVLISNLESTTGHETLWGLLNSMLLPQPEGPNSATNSPFAMVKVNAFNTCRHMPFCVKLCMRFFILSIIMLSGYEHLYLIWEYPTVYLASNPDFPFLTLSRSFGENPER